MMFGGPNQSKVVWCCSKALMVRLQKEVEAANILWVIDFLNNVQQDIQMGEIKGGEKLLRAIKASKWETEEEVQRVFTDMLVSIDKDKGPWLADLVPGQTGISKELAGEEGQES